MNNVALQNNSSIYFPYVDATERGKNHQSSRVFAFHFDILDETEINFNIFRDGKFADMLSMFLL